MRKYTIDWRLLGGFGTLIFFILLIGAIGIFQIQSLSETVENLGKRYLPAQKAILDMKINNSLYAMAVRNYIFWRNSRYLEGASASAKLRTDDATSMAFKKNLGIYSAHVHSGREEAWVESIQASNDELRSMGEKIINIVDQSAQATSKVRKKELEETINKLVMVFENKLYKVNDFLEKNAEKANLESIKKEIVESDLAKNKALSFLAIALLLVLFVGSQTALFVYRDRRREKERRENLVDKMMRIEEEERRNLSLQIHDQMGQDLSGLKIYLDLINKKISSRDKDLQKNISESKNILSDIIEKSHNIAEFLRPPALEEVGLATTIEALIVQYKQMSDINFRYAKPDPEIALSREYALLFYRVVQEGLTNIVKHSKARNVDIELREQGNCYSLSINDDGEGFNYSDFLKDQSKRKRLGLIGLEERAELLGGKMTINTAKGKGMRLMVRLPKEKG